MCNKSFYYTLGEELPNDFFEIINFGFEVNQYLNIDNYDSNQRIQIDNYLKKYPNHIYAIDKLLRGDKPIIEEVVLKKLDLLPRLFESLPTGKINQNESINEVDDDTLSLAAALFYLPYRYLINSVESCEINAVLTQTATSINENSSDTIDFTLTFDGIVNGTTYSITTGGTATEGTDYETIPDLTISNTSETFSLTPTDDSISDINETVTLTLTPISADTNLCNTPLTSSTVTIVDNLSLIHI